MSGHAPESIREGADCGEFALEATLLIGEVAEVRRLLLEALVGIRSLSLDVRALTRVDTAGVQMLLALVRETARRGIELSWRGESPALSQALGSLGLDGALAQGSR